MLAAEEPTTMAMPTGLKAPKACAPVSSTWMPVLPEVDPTIRQSAAFSTKPVQSDAPWVSLHRLASRSS